MRIVEQIRTTALFIKPALLTVLVFLEWLLGFNKDFAVEITLFKTPGRLTPGPVRVACKLHFLIHVPKYIQPGRTSVHAALILKQ